MKALFTTAALCLSCLTGWAQKANPVATNMQPTMLLLANTNDTTPGTNWVRLYRGRGLSLSVTVVATNASTAAGWTRQSCW